MTIPTTSPAMPAEMRLAYIREDISTRLWPINQGMSSALFNLLLDDMAELQYGFEVRAFNELMATGKKKTN